MTIARWATGSATATKPIKASKITAQLMIAPLFMAHHSFAGQTGTGLS